MRIKAITKIFENLKEKREVSKYSKLKNIYLFEFLNLSNDDKQPYLFAFRFGAFFKSSNQNLLNFRKDIGSYSFEQVKNIQISLSSENYTFYEQIKDVSDFEIDLKKVRIFDFILGFNFLAKEIEKIIENETKLLTRKVPSKNDNEERFSGLGVYLQKRAIAQAFGISVVEVSKLPYNTCLLELYTQTILADLEQAQMNKMKK